MAIWTSEIKELEKLHESFKGQLPDLEKELERLVKADDENMILLYSRRCLEVIITYLCECELKRDRGTEPLKGIIDKLNKEKKVPSHIITSMHGLNELSTYGAHPKDFDPEQVKPVLNNLDIIIKWYLKYKEFNIIDKLLVEEIEFTSKQAPEKSIIVLPFDNISSDPEQEYFSDGLTEEIITDLSHIHDLLVISRSSAMTFKGTKKTIPEIAKAVKVRYVLEGSVRKAGDNLRITAQLIDSITDAHMWAEKYTSVLDNVFDIQEKVSKSIVDALKLKLSFHEKEKITIKPTRNIQVYECYLKAKSNIYSVTKESLDRAVLLLQHGLEIFGENALLYATLGEAKYMYYDAGIDISENILNEVAKFAQKALALEPKIAQGHKLYGLLERGRGSLAEGYKHMKRAYITDPNDPTILMYTSLFTGIYCGRHSLAEPLYNRLIEIDPLSAVNYLFLGFDQYFQGNFKKAVDLLKKTSAINPEFFYSDFWLITFLAANNQKQESFDLVDRILKDENIPVTFKELTLFIKHILLGENELALKTLSDATKEYTWKDPDFTVMMPGYYSLIHEKELAFKYLDNAEIRGFINYPWLSEIDPFLENIRGEERFKKLMQRVKYEWENFEV